MKEIDYLKQCPKQFYDPPEKALKRWREYEARGLVQIVPVKPEAGCNATDIFRVTLTPEGQRTISRLPGRMPPPSRNAPAHHANR